MRLAGRRILLTGAASGIGRATSRLFRREGAAVGLIDHDSDALSSAAESFASTPGAALAHACADVANPTATTAAIDGIASELGGLDGVVCAAGIDLLKPFETTKLSEWQRVLDVNLTGAFNVCSAATPFLKTSAHATIVHIASGAGLRPLPQRSAYCAAKAGLVMFAKALAIDLARYHIRVNALCPGAIETPLFRQSIDAAADPGAELERVLERYLIRRVGQPDDIAYAALYLSSDESSYVTGTTLTVDGGRTFH